MKDIVWAIGFFFGSMLCAYMGYFAPGDSMANKPGITLPEVFWFLSTLAFFFLFVVRVWYVILDEE